MANPTTPPRASKPAPKWLTGLVILASSLLMGQSGDGGCRTTEDIKGTDRNVFFPSIRLTKDLSESEQGRTRFNQPTVLGELQFMHGSGQTSQQIEDDEFLDYGGTSIEGPARIEADSDLYVLSGDLRGLLSEGSDFLIFEPIFGLSAQYLRLQLEGGGQTPHDSILTAGPLLGAQLSAHPLRWLDIYGRGSYTLGLGRNFVGLGILEAGLVVNTLPHLDLEGGWRLVRYKESRDSSEPDTDLRLSGPWAGIRLNF